VAPPPSLADFGEKHLRRIKGTPELGKNVEKEDDEITSKQMRKKTQMHDRSSE
jgi:hypothetical protein